MLVQVTQPDHKWYKCLFEVREDLEDGFLVASRYPTQFGQDFQEVVVKFDDVKLLPENPGECALLLSDELFDSEAEIHITSSHIVVAPHLISREMERFHRVRTNGDDITISIKKSLEKK